MHEIWPRRSSCYVRRRRHLTRAPEPSIAADIRSESAGSSWRSVTRASAGQRKACPASITGTNTRHTEGRACPSAGCAYRTRSGRRGRHVPHCRPGVDRAGRGSDRLTRHLSRGLQRGPPVPERPPQGCRQARLWMRDSAGHDLLLIGRPSSASAHDPVLLQPQHRTPRVSPYRSPLATGQAGQPGCDRRCLGLLGDRRPG